MLKLIAVCALAATACGGGAPKTEAQRDRLEDSAQATLKEMEFRDPSLRELLDQAYAYAVFPQIGKGGAIVGGAFGRGLLYERNRPTGAVELTQGSIGAQLGGQSFAELIVLRNADDVAQLKSGTFDVGGSASAVALTEGAARAANVGANANAVFVLPRGGLMADLSVTGQTLRFQPYPDISARR